MSDGFLRADGTLAESVIFGAGVHTVSTYDATGTGLSSHSTLGRIGVAIAPSDPRSNSRSPSVRYVDKRACSRQMSAMLLPASSC